VRADNAKGECYLTDVVALARAEGGRVAAVEAPADELAGINSRGELAAAEAVVPTWLREAAMDAGVTMIDPGSVFLCADTEFAPDVTIEPNVFFGPGVKVATGAQIRAFTHLEAAPSDRAASSGRMPGCDRAPKSARTSISAASSRGQGETDRRDGAKASHLSYLGDADRRETNIGAGTITCNATMATPSTGRRNRARVFIGSDTRWWRR
jgi:bifunctional UDP-N-acetylglucosamine pyrophosphorylase/glucosamine-1-phosphate N-acetyltransferase